MKERKKVSILVPMYNEHDVLPALYGRLSALMDSSPGYDWEVVMVNDGSSDLTAVTAMDIHRRDPRFHIVDLSRNYGKEAAMMAGFDIVSGDCTVVMDADLQHPPEVISQMITKWEEGYDDVYGRRTTRGKEPWIKQRLSLMYYHLLQKTTSIPVLENVGDFRLLDRACVDALCQLRESNRYTKGLYCYIGFRKTDVPFEQADREVGVTKWNFAKLLSLAIEGMTSYTTMPLRIATIIGGIVSGTAIMYLCYILVRTLTVGEPVVGFPTLMVTILFLGGITLFTLGIIGEYIARIFNETKSRPGYFIREIDGKRFNLYRKKK